MIDQVIVGHHEAWKHQSNPNLLPNGQHLEIEFLKDLPEATKLLAEESARNFNVADDSDVSVHFIVCIPAPYNTKFLVYSENSC